MFTLLPTLMGGSFNSGASLSALDRKPSAELMNVPAVIVKRRTMTGRCSGLTGRIHRGNPRLLQIDGLVAAVLVELGAPYFVRALVLGWTEADERPETHVEITHGF